MTSILSRIPARNCCKYFATNKVIKRELKQLPKIVNAAIVTKPTQRTIFVRLSEVWGKLFGKYLLATNIISSGILMAIGDVLAQRYEQRKNETVVYNSMRIGRMFFVGSLQGPLHHYFYQWLDKKMPVTTLFSTMWKILMDQVIMSPLCIALFFFPASLLENKSIQECGSELCSKFVLVYMVDWCVWPAVQFLNFHYLHPKYRVIYINFVTMMYNIFISYVKHDKDFY